MIHYTSKKWSSLGGHLSCNPSLPNITGGLHADAIFKKAAALIGIDDAKIAQFQAANQ